MTRNAKQNVMKLRSFNNDCLTSGFFGSYCTCIPYGRSIEEKGRRHCWMWGLVSLRTSAGLVLAKSYFYSLLDLLLLGCTMGAEVVRSRTNSDLVSIGRGQDFVLVKRHLSHSLWWNIVFVNVSNLYETTFKDVVAANGTCIRKIRIVDLPCLGQLPLCFLSNGRNGTRESCFLMFAMYSDCPLGALLWRPN